MEDHAPLDGIDIDDAPLDGIDIDDAPLDDAPVIIHADLDEFFCQCERDRHPHLRELTRDGNFVPLVVQQHQDIVAVSWEARARRPPARRAGRCARAHPGVRLVHVPSSRAPEPPCGGDRRLRKRRAVMTVLRVRARARVASIDEAYLSPREGVDFEVGARAPSRARRGRVALRARACGARPARAHARRRARSCSRSSRQEAKRAKRARRAPRTRPSARSA